MVYDKYAVILTLFVNLVEGKRCDFYYDGMVKTFFCNAYEFCCGNACCRPAAITFYQLWYFWLSIILILLLCSGGSWWYRFKYRGHVLSQTHRGHVLSMPQSAYVSTTTTHGQGPSEANRPPNTTGVFYYPGGERVYFQSVQKDNQGFRCTINDQVIQTSQGNQFVHMTTRPPMSGTVMGTGLEPPPYAGPPPSYDSVVLGNAMAQQVQVPQSPRRTPASFNTTTTTT